MFHHQSITRLMAASLIVFTTACSTSPTGRSQLKLYSTSQLAEMGKQAFDGMKQEEKVSAKPVENEFVSCVARHITRHVPQHIFDGEWEVVVFDSEQVNAFALPGGKIGVYTGLLEVTENQHQLAAVMGHEVGHVIAEHGNERMSNSTLVGIGMQVTNQILAANEVANSGMIMAALGVGVQVGVQLPFSRTHESEADLIGLDLMARAGFDPRESVNLWHNMDKSASGQRPPELLSTHPLPSTRIKMLEQNMSAAVALQGASTDTPRCKK